MSGSGYYIYVIKSTIRENLYVGMTANPDERLKQHNAGKSKFTSAFRPWEIVYTEFVGDRKFAREREKYFKSGAGRSRLKRILESN